MIDLNSPATKNIAVLVFAVCFVALGIYFSARRRMKERRTRLNPRLCPNCNYDRTGLPGGSGAVCPECGAAAPKIA